MAHNLKSAVKDLLSTVKGLGWLNVQTDDDNPGSGNYTLTVTLGGYVEELHFGAVRKTQELNVKLFCSGPKVDTFDALDRCQQLSKAIIADRRRGTHAQSTTVGEWTTEGSGRDGVTFEAVAEITTNETN